VIFVSFQFLIGTISYADEFRKRLNLELKFLQNGQVNILYREAEIPPWSFTMVGIERAKGQGEHRFACRFAVAKAVTDLFINHLEANFVKNYTEKVYSYCSPQDRFEIVSCTLETLEKLKIIRRNRILQSVYDFLADNRSINIEGFAKFRLRNYWKQLQCVVRRTGQEYLNAKDYQEFVRLLRCFIEMQEPKMDEVHIFVTVESTFFICDRRGNIIRKEHLCTPSFSVNGGEFNYKDYLLSMLITLVPKTIVFHVSDHTWESDPLRTIQQVFEDRICRCSGCDRCRHLLGRKQ
jgi:putative sporulation protein YtxC